MKLFFGEFKADYSHYRFPYQVWLLKEEGDEAGKIYENGFLPMRNMPDVYYLCRSVRVNIHDFELSSENRRILKKTESFESDMIPLSEFDYTPEVQKFCKNYADEKLGKGLFAAQSIKTIFTGKVFNYLFVFKEIKTQKPVGYAVCFVSGKLLQYAHTFYDLAYYQDNLGARMMLEAIVWAKKSGKEFAYLGTCYEESALYKTEFKGVEFFSGFSWSSDLEELKRLVKRDEKSYLFKDNQYLKEFYQGDIYNILNNYGLRVNI